MPVASAEARRQTTTIENVTQSSMARSSLHVFLRQTPHPAGRSAFQPSLEKIPNNRRFDARSDHGASDRLEQDEGEMSAFDLLVLSHQRHQRVSIGQTFLGES